MLNIDFSIWQKTAVPSLKQIYIKNKKDNISGKQVLLQAHWFKVVEGIN